MDKIKSNGYHYQQSNGHNYTSDIGRSKPNICRYARTLGLTSRVRIGSTRGITAIEQTVCLGCSVIFEHKRVYAETRKFCSHKCADSYNGVQARGKHLWADRPHPRGMLGKKHSEELRHNTSVRAKKMWADPNCRLNSVEHRQRLSDRMSKLMIERIKMKPSSVYSRTHKGWAEFSGGKRYYFRSGWELRYAKYLEMLKKAKGIVDWTYEEDTYWFEKIRRGVRSYTPDFKVYMDDGTYEYHEVKGWMDPKSKTKLKRMGIYYPKEVVIVIDEHIMKNI